MIVALDGPAGVGKSTIAAKIAEKAGFFYLNSGNFYRAATYSVLKNNINTEDVTAVVSHCKTISIAIINNKLCLDGKNIEDELHTDLVEKYVAKMSAIVELREIITAALRKTAVMIDVVAEGRDITTVVFPDAEIKYYMDASLETRAERRYKQGTSIQTLSQLVKTIRERDEIDKNKPVGSLKKASDAVYLDTTDLTIDEVCEKVLHKIQEKRIRRELPIMTDKDVTTDINNLTLQEEYLKNFEDIEEGSLIEGEIIQITSDHVFIDVGYKSEGKISLDEFEAKPKIGDKVCVILLHKEGKSGQVVVSKKKADLKVFWKNLREASEAKTPIDGTVCKVIKGGFEVDLGFDVRAFNPISKIDVVRVENPEEYLNIKSKFIIDKFSTSSRARIVVSRRQYLEAASEQAKSEFYKNTKVGDDVEGTVKSFTSFGAFIDLGGFDGLLHINDMSWGHVTKPKDYVKKGQKINLKVIKIDPEEKKINLSLKHFTDNPWNTFELRYHIDDVVKGKVTKLTEFGAFIEIEEGIEGLAHISELSWTKRVSHPGDLFAIGDEVEVKILAYNLDEGRISLGVKQVLPNPWDNLSEKYPIGKVLKKVIKKVTNSGAFVELEEGIDAFLHIDDFSWTRKVKNASSVLKEGEEIEAIVIDIEPDTNRVRLGVKQLSDDPWENLKNSYPKGSVIEGEITSVTDFGVFVRVVGGIEGLVNKFNLKETGPDRGNEDEILKQFNVGDKVKAIVSEIKPGAQRLSLSIREYQRSLQREELSKYIHDSEEEGNFTLGDMLKDKINLEE